MKKHLGQIAALVGLLASIWLVAHDNPRATLALLRTAGLGLAVAGLVHVLPMLANARAWQTLLAVSERPRLAAMLRLVWIRESVNGLLPVARLGGEIVSFRLMRQSEIPAPAAVASMMVDIQLTVIGQLFFTLLGIGYLFTRTASASLHLAGYLVWGVVALAPLLLIFAFIQHARPFERMAALLNRISDGKLAALVGHSAEIDRQIKLIWGQRGAVLRYLLIWYPLQCLATALEIWAALFFLRAPISFLDVLALEALIQAASSAAFFVPGGLGVQEGAFVLVGGVFGLDPSTGLALAGARRVRDLMIFVPGLLGWQKAEAAAKAALRNAPEPVSDRFRDGG